MVRRSVLVLLVSLLAFDMSTPLLPGAYRFNPDESVEVLRDGAARVGVVAPVARPHPTAATASLAPEPSLRANLTVPARRPDTVRPVRSVTVSSPDPSSRSTDDH
jgi:hypothetical protein